MVFNEKLQGKMKLFIYTLNSPTLNLREINNTELRCAQLLENKHNANRMDRELSILSGVYDPSTLAF